MNRRTSYLKASIVCSTLGILALGSANATLIDFTYADGYRNGILNGQPGGAGTWRTQTTTQSHFQVAGVADGSSEGYVSVATTVNGPIAGFSDPVNFTLGGMVSTSMDFQFTQSAASTNGLRNSFGLNYATSQTTSVSSTLNATFGRQANATDGYRMTAFGSSTSYQLSGTQLGLNSALSDNTSDVIRMTLTLIYATPTTLNGVVTLFNVTQNMSLLTITTDGISYGGVTPTNIPTSLYSVMQIANSMSSSSLSNVSILNYNSPTVVPEPGTVALAGLGLGVVLLMARRKKS